MVTPAQQQYGSAVHRIASHGLPDTGLDVVPILLLAVGLIVLGYGLRGLLRSAS